VAGKVYNVGRGHGKSDREVVGMLAELMGMAAAPTWTGSRPVLSPGPIADVRRAEVDLGFCASTDLERGLRQCVEARALALGRPHFGRAWAQLGASPG
jgi:nucleoside-diphosphate-sugar epimerase